MNDERVAAHKTPWASIKEYIINIGTKSLFLMAMADLQRKWDGPFPIRLKIKHNRVQALATQTIKAGELFVPLFLMNPRSVVAENDTIMTPLHQEPLFAEIAWSEFQYPVRFMIQPELQSAKLRADGSIQEVPPDVHPFWFIQRTGCEPHRSSLGPYYRSNARITTRDFHFEKSGRDSWGIPDADKLLDTLSTFEVALPVITNTRAIQAGHEVILKRIPPRNPQPCDSSRANTEVGQIMMEDTPNRKRQRTD